MSLISAPPAKRRLLAIPASALITALLVSLLLVLFPTTSHAKPRTCRAEGSTTVLKSSHVRVYQISGAPAFLGFRVYGCVYSKDKPYLLNPGSTDCDDDFYRPENVRLAGRYVGYTLQFCSEFGPVTDAVRVRDLVTGELLVETSGSQTLTLENGFRRVTDMELKANGSVAWIVHRKPLDPEPPEAEEVRKSDRTIAKGPRTTSKLLDSGEGIETDSLTRKGSRVSWNNAGVRKTARLR